MALPGPALCLFDVDGTLTAPRQVGDARQAGGKGCGTSCCSQMGLTTPPRVGVEGRLRTAYLFWRSSSLYWVVTWRDETEDLSVVVARGCWKSTRLQPVSVYLRKKAPTEELRGAGGV